jgi:hypothetical protein
MVLVTPEERARVRMVGEVLAATSTLNGGNRRLSVFGSERG